MGGRKVLVLQGSCRVTTRQLPYLGKFKPSRMETIVCIQVASKVEMSRIGQSRSERIIGIRESLYCRVVVELHLGNYCSSEIRYSRIADSDSYRGSINSGYIRRGLSGSLSRKGLCTRL